MDIASKHIATVLFVHGIIVRYTLVQMEYLKTHMVYLGQNL